MVSGQWSVAVRCLEGRKIRNRVCVLHIASENVSGPGQVPGPVPVPVPVIYGPDD